MLVPSPLLPGLRAGADQPLAGAVPRTIPSGTNRGPPALPLAASESNERHQMMGDGGQPHGGGSSFGVELPLVTRSPASSAKRGAGGRRFPAIVRRLPVVGGRDRTAGSKNPTMTWCVTPSS